MKPRVLRLTTVLGIAVAVGCGIAACGSDGGSGGDSQSTFSTGNAHGGAGGAGPSSGGGDVTTFVGSGGSGAGQSHTLEVTPTALQTIDVAGGATTPTVTFKAKLDGSPVKAGWSVDRGEVGKIPGASADTAEFTPSGNVGGLVNVTAAVNVSGKTFTAQGQVFVKLASTQNGPGAGDTGQVASTLPELTSGGGIGGVGGEGLGGIVTDAGVLASLDNPTGDASAQGFEFLYPYDKTVWPRGLLAPNLQWRWTPGDAQAIRIELKTQSGSFNWTGTFGRPAILATSGGKFIRHPIPQSVWKQATELANGASDKLTMELTVAQGGVAYGGMKQTWTIAPARLSGIIYYQSYGTLLAKNHTGAVGGDGSFGAATLSIHVGDSGPALTAGSNGGDAQCRVCHSVASNGSRLISVWGNGPTSIYDLTPTGNTETQIDHDGEFAGLYPDGSKALTQDGTILPFPDDSNPLPTVTGLDPDYTKLSTPMFSPDGKQVAFTPFDGDKKNTQRLLVMKFNPNTLTFSNAEVVADDTGQPAGTRLGWPAFLPDGKSVVYNRQTVAGWDGNGDPAPHTRKGARAQIYWTSSTDKNHVTRLNQLNGYDAQDNVYLPKLLTANTMLCTADGVQVGAPTAAADNEIPNPDLAHEDNVNMNYEPTVNPIASGGYAWVVFTSRRMYGNVADIPPYCSDPRGVNLVSNITTKKLWVAAIDLSAPPGEDASHPAFYLPGQEFLAGNARGFWVLDPCRDDNATCESGDQCCGGFCQPDENGDLVCKNESNTGGCSQTQEKCETTDDCCNTVDKCINGFCAQGGIH